ncbi:translation initiation factor IF-2 [Coprobacillus sp. CAG:698]|nr:translation initiation factor IF-2 [Coprobacillus sp. CAG:698]
MKVSEILEILTENGVQCSKENLFDELDNIGYENVSLDTDIDINDVKKLSKRYKTDIKPKKVKKEPKKVEPKKTEVKKVEEKKTEVKKVEPKKEKPASNSQKPVKKESAKKPTSKETEKKPAKKEAVKEVKKTEEKKAVETFEPKKETVKVEEKPKETKKNNENVELTRFYDDKYDVYEKNEKQYTRIKNVKKTKKIAESRQSNTTQKKNAETVIYYEDGMTAGKLAEMLGVSNGEIVKKLVGLGYMISITQPIDRDVFEILADDYGYTVKDKVVYDITKFEDIVIDDDEENLVPRPPIVTIMGHVDHGKTTLLDTIRSSRITSSEAGGITQRIGAYQVEVHGKKITFIDTPGHAAFTEMRARGANVTDIVVLVVAADDGVMPQTKEAIDHALSAHVPLIVAVNKIDKHGANADRVKEELAALNIIPSEWGGNNEFVNISALKGTGVDELLETILMVAEMENYRANPNRLGYGTVIEAQLTKGRGPVATLLVKNGTIKVGDPIVVGTTYGKIRAMQDETKTNLKSAGPSKAVEITGLESVPQAGDHFMIFDDDKTAKLVSEERQKRVNAARNATKGVSLATLFENLDKNEKEINLIIKGDLQGSVEALQGSLLKLNVEGVKINIVSTGVGAINDNDITLAVASKSIIIGFNIRPNSTITKQATDRGVEIRLYNIIYKLLEDIEAAMKGLLDPVLEEKVIGEVEVRKIFKVSKIGTIAGSYVTNGVITRNSEVRLIRDGVVVYTGKVGTLRRGQDDVKEVKFGFECGITIQNYNDIKEGDIIEAYIMEKVEQ